MVLFFNLTPEKVVLNSEKNNKIKYIYAEVYKVYKHASALVWVYKREGDVIIVFIKKYQDVMIPFALFTVFYIQFGQMIINNHLDDQIYINIYRIYVNLIKLYAIKWVPKN